MRQDSNLGVDMSLRYSIADIVISSDRDLSAMGLRGFAPFEIEGDNTSWDCHISFTGDMSDVAGEVTRVISSSHIEEAGAKGVFATTKRGYLYRVEGDDKRETMLFHIDATTLDIVTNSEPRDARDVALLRFGLWMMFGVVLSQRQAIAIHSSVIECRGRGVLFLGESGTGKSTHTQLWREHIEGSTLLNDDSPIVRIVEGQARVYGSPWSGKRPCYKPRYVPIAGICRLSQAPHNVIRRLSTIAAIGALLPSCPPQYAHDERLQDRICRTLGEILRSVAIFHLECLPNSEAAKLSHRTIIGDE